MKELEGLDAPLPLPDALRARLEAQLLAPVPLEQTQRSALEARLVRRPRRWLVPAAAAAAAVAVLGGVLLLDSPAPPPADVALRPSPTASAAPLPTPSRLGAVGGADAGTGSTGGGSSLSAGKGLTDKQPVPAAGPLQPPAGPALWSVNPATASVGAAVELRGSGLSDPVSVRFGSADAEVVEASAYRLLVRVPPGAGTVDVVVRTASGASPAVRFTYR